MTPCDFFLWGHVKEKVLTNKSASIQYLKDGIREAIKDIKEPLRNLVINNSWNEYGSVVVVMVIIWFILFFII